MTDPFAAPAHVPSEFARIQSFHGRLCLWKPTATDMVPNEHGQLKPRLTVDITVVDGAGPLPMYEQRVHTGKFLDGPEFRGTYVSGQRLVVQLDDALKSGGMVLGRLGLYKEGKPQGQGNPWGIVEPTEEDKQIARQFLATRTVGAAQAPAAAQVQQPSYTPPPANFPTGHSVQAPAVQYAPQTTTAQAPPAAPSLPLPGSAPAGVNPFA